MQKLDGKVVSNTIYEEIKHEVKNYNFSNKILAIVTVGGDSASEVYVASKKAKTEYVGYNYMHIKLGEKTVFHELSGVIDMLNNNPSVKGIIVQKPLPKQLQNWDKKIDEMINPDKDVDGFHPMSEFNSCTPQGIMTLLDYYKVPYEGKNVVIAGRSKIVAQPLAKMLMDKNCTVTMIHSKTDREQIMHLIKKCDIFVSAIGIPKYWDSEFIKPHYKTKLAVIDVGINRIMIKDPNSGAEIPKLVGDVDPEVYNNFEYYTPVPGGVGLMTVATLISNLHETV